MNALKDAGKAGLYYAYDSNGHYTPADQAIVSIPYYCPICGVAMHVTTTKKGKKIFIRYPHKLHINSICYTIERKRIEKTFETLDPVKFITSLCYSTPRKKTPPPPGGSTKPVIDIDPDEDPESEETDSKLAAFTSLRQIAESGISYLGPNDVQGDHLVSDFILTFRYAEKFFSKDSFILGARIVYARYMWHSRKDKSIVFAMFNRNFSVKFRIHFPKTADYNKYRDKIGESTIDTKGKTIFKKRHKDQDVLIASDDWCRLDLSQCSKMCTGNDSYCRICKGMYQATFTSSKQIYLLPGD